MDEYLRFENAIFCSSSCNSFIFNNVLTTVNTTDIRNYNFTKNHWISNPVISVRYFAFPPKFNVLFKFNYSKYNPRGLIFGGAYTWKEFSISKVGC